jgi:large subunit ribosomal protein L15
MVVKHRKKYRKRLGRRTYHGDTKRRRGAGSRGGVGKAGSKSGHTKLIYQNQIGKKKRLHPKREYVAAVNVGELQEIAKKLNTNEINLTQLGIEKLLGKGKINEPITVIVKSASKNAIEKIENAGGKVVLEGEEQ